MRMAENVRRMNGELVTVENEWGTQVNPAQVEDALKANPDAKILAFVHAETSTGVRSDAQTLCTLAQQYDCLSIVDSVTGLAGVELEVDAWNADVTYSGTQKCLSAPPGISLITFSDKAAAHVKARNTPVQSWFLDLSLLMAYWEGDGARTYHHTAPVNAMYGLHESLLMLKEEGLENSWYKHRAMHDILVEKLNDIGLEFVVDASFRLPQLNLVKVPEGVDEAAVRTRLLMEFNLEIGAGLGAFAGKVWRIGLMGYSARQENIQLCTSALKHCIS
jgi:alanine-glyoxylate transaminase/serine-glyoxylate transaminase/serine-pyruvate transaminase